MRCQDLLLLAVGWALIADKHLMSFNTKLEEGHTHLYKPLKIMPGN